MERVLQNTGRVIVAEPDSGVLKILDLDQTTGSAAGATAAPGRERVSMNGQAYDFDKAARQRKLRSDMTRWAVIRGDRAGGADRV